MRRHAFQPTVSAPLLLLFQLPVPLLVRTFSFLCVCVCHTHGGLETQALQDAAGGSLLGQQTTNALSRRILARSELVYEKDAWQLLLSSLL